MLSNTCKYGIRAVVYLAVNQEKNDRIGIKKIAKDLNLPAPFLGKILQDLVKKKLLNSTKGPNGGFGLNREPINITLFDIVVLIDGQDIFEECMIGLKICEGDEEKKKVCPFFSKSNPARNKLRKAFEEQTIEDFVAGIKNSDEIMKF